MTSISVIIPAYNRALLIGETLRSLLSQTVPADEIIVVDDGSTDETSNAALAAFDEWKSGNVKGKKLTDFRVISQENSGPAKARNSGVAASTGEFIHFFDSDDLAAPNKHEVQLNALLESGAEIAYGPWVKGKICDGTFTPENSVLQQRGLPNGDLIEALLTNWSIVPHACLFRRSIVEKTGGFPEHLYAGEDQLMFLNCLLSGAKVVHTLGTLELYRIGVAGKITDSGTAQNRHAAQWARFLVDADQACRKHGISPTNWYGFRARAWEAIQDMKKFGIVDQDLIKSLNFIKGAGTPDIIYLLEREMRRKFLGLKSRLVGNRENSSFMAAPLTNEQKLQIQKMGLQLT